ncbi:MAG: hypothetical protein CMO67_05505 [Verrucomicrobiales bacterium]|nr:hypothetical protein [Verrucomicrobiales bacterium]
MAEVAGVVTIRWDVLPTELSEVRRLSLYPFKQASKNLDAEMTANPATIFAGAFRENQPIGCIAVLPEPNHGCTARIRWFGVLENERGQGVGTQLVAAAQKHATDSDQTLWADVRIKAIPIYERLGFEPLGDFFELPEIGLHRVMRWGPTGLRS